MFYHTYNLILIPFYFYKSYQPITRQHFYMDKKYDPMKTQQHTCMPTIYKVSIHCTALCFN